MTEQRTSTDTILPAAIFDGTRYGLIIDARSSAEYADWHFPGALNLPEVEATAIAQDGEPDHRVHLGAAAENFRRMADAIDGILATCPRQTRILVYGKPGSPIIRMWADALEVIGFKVDLLPQGVSVSTIRDSASLAPPQPHVSRFKTGSSISAEEAVAHLTRYALAIDARSEREFEHDHLPGAINLPVVITDEYAEVGTLHRQEKESSGIPFRAYLVGVAYSLRNMADALETQIATLPPTAPVLVYCFRGGKRSRLWSDALTTLGYAVHRVEGGWKAYRRWVNAQLESFPSRYRFNVLCGPTGCGKTRLLEALHVAGAQVLDLEGLARHRGSLIGALPGIPQPSQKWFDSLLLQELRSFDPGRPVWTESESKKIGEIRLPECLIKEMHSGTAIFLDVTMDARVRLWREDYRHFEADPVTLLNQLQYLKPLVGSEELEKWTDLVEQDQVPLLFERLMRMHYDPLYQRSLSRSYTDVPNHRKLELQSLDREYLAGVASLLHGERIAS